jgi:hypothetical protein
VITSVRPTEEFDLEIHNFVESSEYKASKSFCLDMRRHIIDTRAQMSRGNNEGFVPASAKPTAAQRERTLGLHCQFSTGAFFLWVSHSMALGMS